MRPWFVIAHILALSDFLGLVSHSAFSLRGAHRRVLTRACSAKLKQASVQLYEG